MTIAAGLLCDDGLLICADTEHSGDRKFHQRKVYRKENGIGEHIVAGSGNYSYIGMASDLIEEGLYENRDQFEECDAREQLHLFKAVLRQRVKTLHEHIKTCTYDGLMPSVELIVGLHTRHDDLSLIYVGMDGGVKTVEEDGVFIGVGAPVATAFSRILLTKKFTRELMKPLAFFLLYQAKQSAPGCSGDTTLSMLPRPHIWSTVDERIVAEPVEEAMRLILVYSRDLSIPNEQFNQLVDELAVRAKRIRQSVEGSVAFHNMIFEEFKKGRYDKLLNKSAPSGA